MTKQEVIEIAQKTITGERTRISGLTSEEAIFAVKYIFYEIFELSENDVLHIISTDFLKKYDILRYYRLVETPKIITKVKLEYFKKKICPSYRFSQSDMEWDKYLETVRNTKKQTIWEQYREPDYMFFIIHRLFNMVFTIDSLEDFLLFADYEEGETAILEVLKIFRLDDFYNEMFIYPLDLAFFCLPRKKQEECKDLYFALRSDHSQLSWMAFECMCAEDSN